VVVTSPVWSVILAPFGALLALLVRPSSLARRASPLVGALCALAVWLTSSLAGAFTPPPAPVGHVNDLTHHLSAADQQYLDDKLARYEQGTTNQIAVLVLDTLGEDTIEDAAFTTFQAWKLGQKGKDNGVLMMLVTGDRRTRIETGKGVGGDLTDLQTNDILKRRVGPRLAAGDLRGAIDSGTDGIIQALGGNSAAPRTINHGRQPAPQKASPARVIFWVVILVVIFVFIVMRRGGGGGGGGGILFLPGFGGGGGDGGGGGGGGGDGGFSGGGGESGGGGSSDSY
jgi:uncharacterized protein